MSRWEEVFGQVIAEAMASRKPIVATRVGGIPELVSHNDTGFLVERGDAAAMAQSILCLLHDATRRIEMGNNARASVETEFDHRKNVSKLIELYGLRERNVKVSKSEHFGEEPVPSSIH
jgi:glycosyltransferase involved in cell wall biosynthesis